MADDNGFIVIHRKITQWEWYTDANTYRVFMHLLLLANHKETRWRGEVISRGQVLTGRHQLSRELRISERGIRTALEHLKTTNELTIRTTNHFSVITINNYCEYQDKKDDNRPTKRPAKRQSTDQQPTTSNNVNNVNKEDTLLSESSACRVIDVFVPPSKREAADFFLMNGSTVEEAGKFWYHFDSNGWKVGGRTKMKSWTSAARKWILTAKTTLNGNGYAKRNGTLGYQQPITAADMPDIMQSIANDPRFK